MARTAEEKRLYQRRVRAGQIPPLVPTVPVLDHLLGLVERGMSWTQIGRLAGVSPRYLATWPGKVPERIHQETARRLLGVRYVAPGPREGHRVRGVRRW